MSVYRLAASFLLLFSLNALGQTFWTNSTVPVNRYSNDSTSVTLGLRFSSDVPGIVTGVRFYKGTGNTGTHKGQLWSSSGAKLAEVTFANETASGWQQALFSTPITIAANTTYVVSYLAPYGRYSYDANFPWANLNATPLRVSGSSPGVYGYGSLSKFPTSTWNRCNYWVDVMFTPSNTSGTTVPTRSLWPASTMPTIPEVTNDSQSVTLGVKFYSEVSGKVTGVRFFKGPHNLGTHVGHLWSSTGTKLAEVTFTGESTSGWQQANFPTPVNITANTAYVISYLAPMGNYAQDQYFAWSGVNPAPLHVSGSSPGVFAYGSTSLFPTGTYNSTNYWVDVVFVPGATTPPVPTPTFGISGRVSGTTATVTLSGTAGASTTTDATGNYQFSGLTNGSYVVTPTKAGYTFTPSTAAVSINGASVAGINFAATATPPAPTPTFTISGRVSGSTATVTLSGTTGASTTTDATGNYQFTGLTNGSYVVAPSKPGYTFTPSTASVSINGGSVAGINFAATATPPPVSRTVSLGWVASTSSNCVGYNVYRATVSGGPYAKINGSPISGTSYVDSNVAGGMTYFYVATAVDGGTEESNYSTQASAVVPQ